MNTPPSTSAAVLTPAAVAPALLERHKAALRSYVHALTKGDAAKVEAIVEAVWLEAQGAGNAEFEEDPTIWLFAHARRRVVGSSPRDILAGESGGGSGEDEAGNPGEEPLVVVHRTINSLTAKQQEALRLKFQFNLSLDEIASITGQAKSGTGGLLHHAVVRIGKALGAREDEASPLANDPRVTAYALDEMDADERKYFEKGVMNGKALLEREKAIREWSGHITTVLSSGAPVPKRRRKRRWAVWWKSKSLWIGLALSAACAVLGLGWQKFKDRAGPEDAAQGLHFTEAAGHRPDSAETPGKNSRGTVVSGPGVEIEMNGRREREEPGPRVNPETGNIPRGSDYVGSAVRGDERKPMSVPESNPGPPIERRVAMPSPATGGLQAAAKNSALPSSGAGPGEARKEIDLIKEQPGKRKGTETVDALPNMVGVQRQLALKQWPKREQVRLEELLKFAPPAGLRPTGPNPIEAQLERVHSPWDPQKQIVRVSFRAKDSPAPARGPANLVFAIDVSQSMAGPNRLPLVQEGVRRLVDRLRPDDLISVVTYAAKANLALSAQPAERSGELRHCLAGLEAVGLTNGSAGLTLAYETVRNHWIEGGINVVVLCTDGNFNLGTTDEWALGAMAAAQAKSGIRLSVFGFGRTDRNDLRLEVLATNGGGRSCYVNTEEEAERQLVEQIDGLFAPVARDVRLQVNFNPVQVEEYQRIGDGSVRKTTEVVPALLPGRSVTAMFELTPGPGAGGLGRLQLDYTLPESGERQQLTALMSGTGQEWAKAGLEFRFAIAMAEFGRILRNGQPADTAELDRLEAWAQANLPEDTGGYRTELLQSLDLAKAVVQSQAVASEAK